MLVYVIFVGTSDGLVDGCMESNQLGVYVGLIVGITVGSNVYVQSMSCRSQCWIVCRYHRMVRWYEGNMVGLLDGVYLESQLNL